MKRIASAALLLVLASTLVAVAAQQQPAYTSIQGTVHALQPKTGSFDVVTGVGMSLRIVHLVAPPAGEAAVPLSALKRGDIVRVQCHWSGKQLIADRIEKVGPR
ncbi:MAG: hypothetical protein E6K74_05530 [Candidatus Eisenbacteria bacterium]|uniref:DUF5666 domain-containing protein n=1 Tax=Eiseniibacteriota bacterium TaxID=2212470 RepID=A0A538STC7_UNCEI|nr:MAG: hypothetical protein E6K74_05530 [Candidatus Eisenbacteria bacterium]